MDVRLCGSLVPKCGSDADVGLDAVRLAILADGWVVSALVLESFGVASANFVGATDFVVPPAAREVC